MISPAEISKTGIFFITGRPRSGTTLLWALFDAHPNIIIPYECTFIVDFYPKYGHCKNWDKKILESFFNDLIKQPLLSFWNLDKLAFREKILSLPPGINYSYICKYVYLQFESLMPKENVMFIGDKNPIHTIHMKRLSGIFPEAKFIHITRDFKDQIASMLNVNFEKPVLSSLAYRWKYFNKTALSFAAKNPDKVFFIKYEDLVQNPKKIMKDTFRFLDIPYSMQIFEFYKIRDHFIKTYTKENVEKYHKELFQPINPSRIGIWKKTLTRKNIKKIEAVIDKHAAIFGYDRMFPKTGFGDKLISIPGKIFGMSYYFIYRTIYWLPVSVKRKMILSMDRSLKK
jgi:hypothetical protein